MLIDAAKYYDAADRFLATFQAFIGNALDDYHCGRESLLTTSGRAGMRASLSAAGKKGGHRFRLSQHYSARTTDFGGFRP